MFMRICQVFEDFDHFWTTQKNPFTQLLAHSKTRGWVDFLKNPGFFPNPGSWPLSECNLLKQ
jgi:hypothetical protein